MNKTLIALVAATFLLTACETAPTGAGGSAGMGHGAGASGEYGSGAVQELAAGVGDRVFFDFDSSVIKPEAQDTLRKQAKWLTDNPHISITIEGHCDERGTREYNLALGERRANAAKNFLVSQGVPASRVNTISYGKERPAVLGSNEEAWGKNRRAVTVVN